jgi:hypothetical protein
MTDFSKHKTGNDDRACFGFKMAFLGPSALFLFISQRALVFCMASFLL